MGTDPAGGLVAHTPAASTVAGGVLAAATAYADRTAADVVDLLPDGLGAEALLAVARRTPADRPPGAAPTAPAGAGYALLLRPSLVERLGRHPAEGTGLGAQALAGLSRAAGRAAAGGRSTVVAPGLAPPAGGGGADAWARLDAVTQMGRPYTSLSAMAVAARGAHLALAGGLLVSPVAGAAAVAAWWAKPAVATGGRAPDALAATARRPLAQVVDLVRLAGAGRAASQPGAARRASGPRLARPERRRGVRAPPNDLPVVRVARPGRAASTRPTCCSTSRARSTSTSAATAATSSRTRALSLPASTTTTTSSTTARARSRGAALRRPSRATPAAARRRCGRCAPSRTAWLDVGTGHGHFCLAARQRWPEVRFDGLDLSESVNEADRRGWVDTAYRGLFPELAGGLPAAYDVVSMHHYLEHTRDPSGRAGRRGQGARRAAAPDDRGARHRVAVGRRARARTGCRGSSPSTSTS